MHELVLSRVSKKADCRVGKGGSIWHGVSAPRVESMRDGREFGRETIVSGQMPGIESCRGVRLDKSGVGR
jgi:hypothetical protein